MINLLFSAFPYVALAVLGGGILVRYILTYRRIAAVSAEASHAWAVFGGGKVWRTSFVLLALAHLAGMAFPKAILLWNGASVRLLVLEATGFLAGLMAVIGCAGVMRRHLQRSGASVVSELGDCLLVALMFVGLLSGLLTAAFYRWGSSWSAVTIAPFIGAFPPLRARIERAFILRRPNYRAPNIAAQIVALGNREVEAVLLELLEDLTMLRADLEEVTAGR